MSNQSAAFSEIVTPAQIETLWQVLADLLPVEKSSEAGSTKLRDRSTFTPGATDETADWLDAHGTGRAWVSQLMARVLGPWNCARTRMKILCDNQFHDYLYNTLLCTIDEVKENDKRYEVNDKIRDVLTEPRFEVNRKYGSKKTTDIYTGFCFTQTTSTRWRCRKKTAVLRSWGGRILPPAKGITPTYMAH